MTSSATPRSTHVTTDYVIHSRLSWGAVFAGLLIALMVQLLLTVIGTAIGLAAWDPSSGKGLGIGAGIWALLSMLIALYAGGATAGWVAAPFTRQMGMLHGALVWSLTTLLTLWMLASGVGAVVGTTFRMVGNVIGTTTSAAVQGVTSAATRDMNTGDWDMSSIRSEIESMLRQTGNPNLNPDALQDSARRAETLSRSSMSNQSVVDEISSMISGTASSINREDVINVIVARTDMSRADAERAADRLIEARRTAEARMDTLKQRLGEGADEVTGVASTTLWFALAGMILSLAAAALGAASMAGRERERLA